MTEPIRTTANKIANKEISSTEIVERCFTCIKKYNPAINAVVTQDEQTALATALQIDSSINAEAIVPSLYGIPLTVKDSFETAGLRTTSSYRPLVNHVPAKDATIVTRLKSAGGVVLGKTNLPELAGNPHCWSPIFGSTNNPWDTSLTSGGSSGGSAAAVAMGFSMLDPGSDIGGSIRIPAAFCGVVGLKATENRIPRTGHIPHLPDGSRSVRHALSFGALARCVDDLRVSLEVMAGPDGIDSEVPPLPVVKQKDIKRPLRIAWWDDFGGLPLCQRTRKGLDRTVRNLQSNGFEIERRCPANFDIERAWYAWGTICGAEIAPGMPAFERKMLSCFGHFFPATQPVARHYLRGLAFDWRRYNDALNIREQLISELEQFLDSRDAWLCPVAPTVAYPHCKLSSYKKPPNIQVDGNALPFFEATISMVTPFSLTGSPVVVLPAGIEDGLPVGLQFVGKRWQDEALLSCCEHVESVTAAFVPPPILGH